ncbi:MAG TPA: ABC transporter ATP-binding protein [Anaerolineae bacterium]|jgi:ABC-2 type transport system ATP-binding protein|nr:ABC transporter ATP-binding protein [Anaerolineae bacterium]
MIRFVIETENLIVDFPSVRAVGGVSIQVGEGEVFGLVGPDGAGKTTTIRVLATILKPTSGSVRLWGKDIVREARAVRGRIGYMSQRFNLYGDLTVEENLRFFADIHGLSEGERKKRTKELLHFARLEAFVDRRAEFLSGGMKQKLALACTLIHEPEILFLDEPTTGVDPVSRREFWAILSELRSRGITLFISTPYMDEAERCSTVAFIDGGKISMCDSPQSIKASLSGEIVELIAKPQREARRIVRGLSYVQDVEVYGERLLVTVDAALEAIDRLKRDLSGKVELVSTVPKAPTMESAFIRVMKGSGYRVENEQR